LLLHILEIDFKFPSAVQRIESELLSLRSLIKFWLSGGEATNLVIYLKKKERERERELLSSRKI